MGAWGTGIFSNDSSADIRDEFRDLIGDGLSAQEATARLVRGLSPEDETDETDFWLALAATQSDLGRLTPEVSRRALRIIENSEDDIARFDSPADRRKRAAALEQLKEKLLAPQRKPVVVAKRKLLENNWPIGAIVSHRMTDGTLALFRVVSHHTDKGGTSPVVRILNWRGNHVPSGLRLFLLGEARGRSENYRRVGIILLGLTNGPVDRTTWTGRVVASPWPLKRKGVHVFAIRPERLDGFLEEYIRW